VPTSQLKFIRYPLARFDQGVLLAKERHKTGEAKQERCRAKSGLIRPLALRLDAQMSTILLKSYFQTPALHQTFDKTWDGLFLCSQTARRTLQGYEIMNMIRKGQVQGVKKGEMRDQATFIAKLFGVAV
jgi:hypothetical protein